MDITHHFSGLEEVIGALEARLARFSKVVGRRRHRRQFWGCRQHDRLICDKVAITLAPVDLHVSEAKFASLIVLLDILFKVLFISFLATRHLIFREKRLSLILKLFHESFSLKMRVETHGWSNLFLFLSGTHFPNCPLRVCWNAIDKWLIFDSRAYSVFIASCGSEIHPLRTYHFLSMAHLRETFPIVISLGHWFHGHLV